MSIHDIAKTTPLGSLGSALGVKGTLQCCGESPCSRFCAWGVWQILVSAVPQERHRKGHIFVDEKGNKLTRAKMIEGWKKVTGKDVTGHSARRSGAMEYIRRGLQIQELAFLGRWKSAVVLTYTNDALQDIPTNRNIPGEARALVISCPKLHGEQSLAQVRLAHHFLRRELPSQNGFCEGAAFTKMDSVKGAAFTKWIL